MAKECKICVNSILNPTIEIGRDGLCQTCRAYKKYFKKSHLEKERLFFNSFVGSGKGKYDIMAGISGGKDSSAMLYMLKKRGFRILAFSFDTGYYPKHIFSRARNVAKKMGVDYVKIDIRKYIRPIDRRSFELMADLYDENSSKELNRKFINLYKEGRKHYSIKCPHSPTFIRTCQLCRRLVVRAYFGEALKNKVQMVVLGINEWAHLSQTESPKFSAIRKLEPFKNTQPVYIVHSPFLFQRKSDITKEILQRFGWKVPKGEKLIESNSNSCLLALAAEKKAVKMLGFHPDSTRLSREITARFITKKQAHKALSKIHSYRYSVRQVLKRAKIL
jgi:hypothetical protein